MKNNRQLNLRLPPARMLALIWMIAALLVSCTISDDIDQERAKIAKKNTGDVIIGATAPWSAKQNGLWNGIEMATDEINQRGGVLTGRKLQIIKKDTHGSVADACNIANEFAQNMNMVAVISGDDFLIAPSVIYQYYGLLFLNMKNIGSEFSNQGFSLAFQTAPDAYKVGGFIARFCLHRKYESLLILHEQSNYFKSIFDACTKISEKAGISISKYSLAYTHGEHGTVLSKKFLQNLPAVANTFDAYYILGQHLGSFRLIPRILQVQGADKPIMINNLFDYKIDLDPADLKGIDILYATLFDVESTRPIVQKFVQAYKQKYKSPPDTWAAQGYDAVHAISDAIEKAKSSAPPDMAAALYAGVGADGVTGQLKFDELGSRLDLAELKIKEFKDGKYQYVYPISEPSSK